jgi:hypothetical protein
MGLETLKSAERAAGFAMAASDDLASESVCEVNSQHVLAMRAETPRSPYQLAVVKASPGVANWVRGMFGFTSGRRAAA